MRSIMVPDFYSILICFAGIGLRKSFIDVTLQIFWQKFYRNIPIEVLYLAYEFCPNRWIWFVAMAAER